MNSTGSLGVLHEPQRLLVDELDDAARASSVLGLIASGANRASGSPPESECGNNARAPAGKLLDLGWLPAGALG